MAEHLDLVTSTYNGNSFYNRSQHKFSRKVCTVLSNIYRQKKVVLVPSGMAAISTVFNITNIKNSWARYNMVYSSELYCDTPRTIKYMSEHYNKAKLFKIDISNDSDVLSVFNTKIDKSLPTVLFIESCSNPSGYIFNFDLINEIRSKNKDLTIIVDNTWVTGTIFNPFDFKVDFVVVSLTKYYSAGSCIAGAIIGNDKNTLMDEVIKFTTVMGLHVSPYNCKLIFKKISDGLFRRVNQSYQLTLVIAKFLQENGIDVTFVGLTDHPSNHLLDKYFKNIGPSVLTFTVNKSKDEVIKWLKTSEYFPYETSFGSKYSKFDPWPQKITNKKTKIRFAVGYEDNYSNITTKFLKMFNITDNKAKPL